MNKQIEILKGIHPGKYLEYELRRRKLKKNVFALSINEHPQTIGAITKEKRRMNTNLALRIERQLDLEEGILLILQIYYDIAQEKNKNQESSPDLSIIRPILFWDTDVKKINWEKNKRAVINRIFKRGNQIEKDEIIRYYGLDTVNKVIKDYAK